jgi:hypothetical protein
MSARRGEDQPPLITDAAPSFDEEQAHRRRIYVVIMIVHLVGFALSYPLYLWQPWAGAVLVVATGGLPWVAVVLANDGPRRSARRRAGAPGPGRRLRSVSRRRPPRRVPPGPDRR